MQKLSIFIVCAVIGLVSATWTWYAVAQSIMRDGIGNWLVSGIAVSIMAVMIIMIMLLAAQQSHVFIVIVLIFASALFFVQGIVIFVAIMTAIIATFSMSRSVRASMNDHIRIRVFTHAHAGIGRMVTALALMISAVFYTTIIERDAATLMLSHGLHATITGPVARMVLPPPLAHGTGANGEVTVDDFIAQILSSGTAQSSAGGENISLKFLENYAGAVNQRLKGMMPLTSMSTADAQPLSSIVLAQARTSLAQELNMSLTGTEPVADVFVQSLEQQIQSFAERNILPEGYKFSKALAGVVAFFLFLSIGWIGSFIKILWIWSAQGLFAFLRKVGMIQIVLVSTQKEELR